VTFEPVYGGTLLTVVDKGYPTDEQRARHESGWPYFLDAFERTLA
jgi:Activator of Hsp90 ATPase homolog 1-like protein